MLPAKEGPSRDPFPRDLTYLRRYLSAWIGIRHEPRALPQRGLGKLAGVISASLRRSRRTRPNARATYKLVGEAGYGRARWATKAPLS